MKGYTITDIGKVRSENQDSVRLFQSSMPSCAVLALCDGMGGANAGGIASEIALSSFMEKITESLPIIKKKGEITEAVRLAVLSANEHVNQRGSSDEKCEGMGTTIVAAVVKGKTCCVVNVGDSRAYLISDGEITQITRDHSLVEEMVELGKITREQARSHPRKNIITRAIGVDRVVECDTFTPEFKRSDILLLCSDGLSNMLSDSEIKKIAESGKSLEDIGKELVDAALSRGAPDNVTVGLLRK